MTLNTRHFIELRFQIGERLFLLIIVEQRGSALLYRVKTPNAKPALTARNLDMLATIIETLPKTGSLESARLAAESYAAMHDVETDVFTSA